MFYLFNNTDQMAIFNDVGLEIGPFDYFEINQMLHQSYFDGCSIDLSLDSGDLLLTKSDLNNPPLEEDIKSVFKAKYILSRRDSAFEIHYMDDDTNIGADNVQEAIENLVVDIEEGNLFEKESNEIKPKDLQDHILSNHRVNISANPLDSPHFASFDGFEETYIEVPDSPSLNMSGAVSIAVWVRIESYFPANSWNSIATKGNNDQYRITMDADGQRVQFSARMFGGPVVVVTTSSPLPLNEWTHLTGVFNGTHLLIYMNGELSATQPLTGVINATTLPLVIGGRTLSERRWTGDIDDLLLYNRALTPAEISVIASRDEYTRSGLVGEWLFDNQTAQDTSGLNNNGIVLGNILFNYVDGEVARTLATISHRNNTNRSYLLPDKNGTLAIEEDSLLMREINEIKPKDADDYLVTNQRLIINAIPTGSKFYATFDGLEDTFIDVPNGPTLNPDLLTICAWVRTDSHFPVNSWNNIVNKGDDSQYRIQMDTDGQRIQFACRINSGNRTVISTNPLPLNQWVHIAGVYNGTQLILYINGLINNSTSFTGTMNVTGSPLRIGARASNERRWRGDIDDVLLYNRALTSVEVLEVYNKGFYTREGLIGEWLFDDQTAQDTSGIGNNGSVLGNVVFNPALDETGYTRADLRHNNSSSRQYYFQDKNGVIAHIDDINNAFDNVQTLPEAPANNRLYGRRNGEWFEVEVFAGNNPSGNDGDIQINSNGTFSSTPEFNYNTAESQLIASGTILKPVNGKVGLWVIT